MSIKTKPKLDLPISTEGLVGYWTSYKPVQTGGTIDDLSGNNNNGVIGGKAYSSPEKGFVFSEGVAAGTNPDTIVISHSSKFNTSAITISCWCNSPSYTSMNQGDLIMKGFDGSVLPFAFGKFSDGGDKTFGFYDGSWHFVSYEGFNEDTWTLITMTYDGNYIKVYDNLVNVGTTNYVGAIPTNAKDIRISSFDSNGSIGSYFKGNINDVLIFNKALEFNQIKSLYEKQRYKYGV